MVNFGDVRRAQLAKSTLLTSSLVPWDVFISFKVCLDANGRVESGKQRELPHLFIPSKTATKVPEFAMEDMPLGRIAALVPEFAVKDLPLGRTLMMMMMICELLYDYINFCYNKIYVITKRYFFIEIMNKKIPMLNHSKIFHK